MKKLGFITWHLLKKAISLMTLCYRTMVVIISSFLKLFSLTLLFSYGMCFEIIMIRVLLLFKIDSLCSYMTSFIFYQVWAKYN